MELDKYLKYLDLNDKEIAVYLALLELSKTNATNLSKKVYLSRTTVIYLLEQLEKRGLIKIMQTRSGREYYAEPPRKVLTLLKNKQNKLDQQVQSFADAVPELNQLYQNNIYEPKVRFYRGRKEIQSIYREMLTLPIYEMRYVGSIKVIEETLGKKFIRQWVKDRIARGVTTKAIRIKSEESDYPFYKSSKEFLRNVRFAPQGFQAPANIEIYGDNVHFFTTTAENIAIVVSSRDFATTMNNWFEELWKMSEPA